MVECTTHFRQLLRIIWTNVNATSRCKDFLLGFWICCFCMILLSLGFYVFGRYNFSESTQSVRILPCKPKENQHGSMTKPSSWQHGSSSRLVQELEHLSALLGSEGMGATATTRNGHDEQFAIENGHYPLKKCDFPIIKNDEHSLYWVNFPMKKMMIFQFVM